MEPSPQDIASFVAQLGGGEIAIGGVGGKRQGMDAPNENSLSPTLAQFGLANDTFRPSEPAGKVADQVSSDNNVSPKRGTKRVRSCERKETMKVYMRNYRMRQKKQMEMMPDEEKEKILAKQRMRVRLRVRRHRLRKKLKASGMAADEIERRLSEMAPTASSRASKKQKTRGRAAVIATNAIPDQGMILNRQHSGDLAMDRHMNAICLDLPRHQPFVGQRGDYNFTRQVAGIPAMGILGGAQPGFAVDPNIMDHFRRNLHMQNNVSKLDFDSATHNFNLQEEQPYEEYTSTQSQAGQVKLSPRRWSVTQVGIFLEGLELGHLKAPFERHGVDGRALLDMTPQSLHESTIVPPNTRAELLSAISSLKKVACVK